jgi:hypothetical protein
MLVFTIVIGGISARLASAQPNSGTPACCGLPGEAALQSALESSIGVTGNRVLGFDMWASLVANDRKLYRRALAIQDSPAIRLVLSKLPLHVQICMVKEEAVAETIEPAAIGR